MQRGAGQRIARMLSFALALLGGCAQQPLAPPLPPDLQLRACIERFANTDRLTADAGLADEGEARIAGFPYLRANRFLASFAGEDLDVAGTEAWLRGLAQLDHRARGAELWNGAGLAALPFARELNRCRDRLLSHDLGNPERLARLRAAVRVPDDYLFARRVLGLYPLAVPFARRGITELHDEARQVFATAASALPVRGSLQRWAAPRAPHMPAVELGPLLAASRDALGAPRPGGALLEQLFAAHAPVWEVDVVDGNDLLGRPAPGRPPTLDSTQPTEYRLVSHTRMGDEVLLQLNYVVWFAARPGTDRYAGALDGVQWRVTLDAAGEVLAYDSVHACGCYHHLFPREGWQLRTALQQGATELPIVPHAAPAGPVVLRLASGTHYLQGVRTLQAEASDATVLGVVDYTTLRMAAGAAGGHGLFARHGLVAGSERGERFLLWPFGVRSPGAMRQWGRQAIAFVGRRHFDDARLFETLLEPEP